MSAVAPVLDHAKHIYTIDGKPLISVSKVIDTVIRKSWEGVDPEVLRNAAERGMLTEKYATEWMQDGGGVIVPPELVNERPDVMLRLEGFGRWYDRTKPTLLRAQQLVWSESDGVAGTLDFILWINRQNWLVDMKCTARPEASWALQVGAYATLSDHHGPCAVLHIKPDYPDGYKWRQYDTETVKRQWRSAFQWYKTLAELKAT